jgi:hypothetical protein
VSAGNAKSPITSSSKGNGLGHSRPSLEDYFFFLDLAFFFFAFLAMVFPLGWEAPEGMSASNIAIRN